VTGLRVTVWNEGVHEADPAMAEYYPTGMHGAIVAGVTPLLPPDTTITAVTLADPHQGLPEELLAATDVLLWWGHAAHDAVDDALVDRVHQRVLGGMGLLVLHSGHYSKIFKKLMGTTCSLRWRDDGLRELVWTVDPTHPIARGVESPIVIDAQEMYGEFFDIPTPDELVFISSFAGGEVFRSGVTYRRGLGRVFYFSPGDQGYPVYNHPGIHRVLANGIEWAAPTVPVGSAPDAFNAQPVR
jgi:trehalose utilization protein